MRKRKKLVIGTMILGCLTAIPAPAWARAGSVKSATPVITQGTGETAFADQSGQGAIVPAGWRPQGEEWYYQQGDGTMCTDELVLDNAAYTFDRKGILESARCLEDTGGGAYPVPCYDEITKGLFDSLNEEKKEAYFDENPEKEDDFDGGVHGVYDRYASFQMRTVLNKAAAHRLEAAETSGYMGDKVLGEGTINDYMKSVGYRGSATYMELVIRGTEDADEALSRILSKTQDRSEDGTDRKHSLTYYRSLGMAHAEKNGAQDFVVILMR